MRLSASIAAVLFAAVAASQCGGGTGGGQAADAIAPAPSNASVSVEVRIAQYKYYPDTVRVKVGQVIRWTNEDNVGHTVTFTKADTAPKAITSRAQLLALNRPKELYSSKLFAQGETWVARFDRPGKFAYICDPHPYMTAVVLVE